MTFSKTSFSQIFFYTLGPAEYIRVAQMKSGQVEEKWYLYFKSKEIAMGVETQVSALRQHLDVFAVERLGLIPEEVLHGLFHSSVRMETFPL